MNSRLEQVYYVVCEVDVIQGHGARAYQIVCQHKIGIIAGIPPGCDPYYRHEPEIIELLKQQIPCNICRLLERQRTS